MLRDPETLDNIPIRIPPGWIGSIKSASAVIDEFDTICTSITPDEADTPLRTHTEAVLPTPVAVLDVLLMPHALGTPAAERSDHGANA